MNIIDENFIDIYIYSVDFYCDKNKKEYKREIITPSCWNGERLKSIILKVFNNDIEIKRIDFLMDAWIPKNIDFFPNNEFLKTDKRN